MIKLLASDLDGTIFDNTHHISINNQKAIDTITKSKIDFVICTGKTYSISKETCNQFNANYGIFGNGMQIINLKTGEEIYKKTLSFAEILNCIEIAKKNKMHIHFYTDKEIVTEKLLYMDLRNYELFHNNVNFIIVPDIKEYVINNKPEIMKIVISGDTDLLDIQKQLKEIISLKVEQIKKVGKYQDKIINKEYYYLDITPNNIGKYEALQILTNKLHVKNEEVMSIGDNLNDLDMIQKCGIGIAVGDAYEEVKKVANYTTKATAKEGAFAEAIYKFIEF